MKKLKNFLLTKMKMTGPYQPVIIKKILENNGNANINDIAKFLSASDQEANNYYKSKLKIYPKQVLQKHGIADLKEDQYSFSFEQSFSEDETRELIAICDQKIIEYYDRVQGDESINTGWGLKRVKLITTTPYCNLCGQKPNPKKNIILDIDHITPRTKGGSDDVSNLQVLCSPCNRAKNNNLIKSAAAAHEDALDKVGDCVFCKIEKERIIFENEYVYLIEDKYPVSKGHSLVIPKRHVSNAFELTNMELFEIYRIAKERSLELGKNEVDIQGYNLGFNIGVTAGQTIFHAHFHIIPRRENDVENPIGGIRKVIDGMGDYKKVTT